MKFLACPGGTNSVENGPLKRYQGGDKNNKISPVSMPGWLEGGRGVGSARDPFMIEAEGYGKGDYRCGVECENGDVKAAGDDAAATRDARR